MKPSCLTQRSSSFAASLPSGIGTVPKPLRRSGYVCAECGDAVIDDLRGLDGDVERHACNSTAAAAARSSGCRWPWRRDRPCGAHGRRRRGMSASCFWFSALVSAVAKCASGIVAISRCGATNFAASRHCDMGMNVDRHALRPHLAPRLAVLACGGRAVFVPLFGHCSHVAPCFPFLILGTVAGCHFIPVPSHAKTAVRAGIANHPSKLRDTAAVVLLECYVFQIVEIVILVVVVIKLD